MGNQQAQITDGTAKGAGLMYMLEVERSDHRWNSKGSRGDILPGGGEGKQWAWIAVVVVLVGLEGAIGVAGYNE
jgi:hypothetical protein